MAIEPYPFLTGTKLSTADFVAVAPDTASASLSSGEQNAKNRVWTLTVGTSAHLPVNPYRAFISVDATAASTAATVSDPSGPTTLEYVPAGSRMEYWQKQSHIGTGLISITAGTGGCIVKELSYV